jgi:hypothetical protein
VVGESVRRKTGVIIVASDTVGEGSTQGKSLEERSIGARVGRKGIGSFGFTRVASRRVLPRRLRTPPPRAVKRRGGTSNCDRRSAGGGVVDRRAPRARVWFGRCFGRFPAAVPGSAAAHVEAKELSHLATYCTRLGPGGQLPQAVTVSVVNRLRPQRGRRVPTSRRVCVCACHAHRKLLPAGLLHASPNSTFPMRVANSPRLAGGGRSVRACSRSTPLSRLLQVGQTAQSTLSMELPLMYLQNTKTMSR